MPRPAKKCSVDGCENKHYGKGYCQFHYDRVRRTGKPDLLEREDKGCGVGGCDGLHHARGMCEKHYKTWLLGQPGKRTCCVTGCNNRHLANGYCKLHYERLRDSGTTDDPVVAGRTTTSQGYVLVLRPDHPNAEKNGYVREHILVMSEMLGRPLVKGESVHHKNGIKDDNRPENLQLLVRSEHHAGQKASDLVGHYAPALTDEELRKAIGPDRLRRLASLPARQAPKQRTTNKLDVGWFSA